MNGVERSYAAWQQRHNTAMNVPSRYEMPHVLLQRLARLLVDLRITEDMVLREAFENVASAAVILLNGERGRLDGGTLDGALRATCERAGYDLDTETWLAPDDYCDRGEA
jgi:hypothetical protein